MGDAHEAGRQLQSQAAEALHAAEMAALRAETTLRELAEVRQMLVATQNRERELIETLAKLSEGGAMSRPGE